MRQYKYTNEPQHVKEIHRKNFYDFFCMPKLGDFALLSRPRFSKKMGQKVFLCSSLTPQPENNPYSMNLRFPFFAKHMMVPHCGGGSRY